MGLPPLFVVTTVMFRPDLMMLSIETPAFTFSVASARCARSTPKRVGCTRRRGARIFNKDRTNDQLAPWTGGRRCSTSPGGEYASDECTMAADGALQLTASNHRPLMDALNGSIDYISVIQRNGSIDQPDGHPQHALSLFHQGSQADCSKDVVT